VDRAAAYLFALDGHVFDIAVTDADINDVRALPATAIGFSHQEGAEGLGRKLGNRVGAGQFAGKPGVLLPSASVFELVNVNLLPIGMQILVLQRQYKRENYYFKMWSCRTKGHARALPKPTSPRLEECNQDCRSGTQTYGRCLAHVAILPADAPRPLCGRHCR